MRKKSKKKFRIPSNRHPLKKYHLNASHPKKLSDRELEALHDPNDPEELYTLVGKKKYRAFWWRVGRITFTKKELERIRLYENGY